MGENITKGITYTIVKGFKLENGAPVPCELELEGALSNERATARAKGILVASVEHIRKYYSLSREIAMEHVVAERKAKTDIQLGETGTTVHALRLVKKDVEDENGNTVTVLTSQTEFCEFHFDAPMTESRAFGAARRAASKAGYDILPYASMQERNANFLPRDIFFKLAKLERTVAVVAEDSSEEDNTENEETAK